METRRLNRRVAVSMMFALADAEGHRDRGLDGDEGGGERDAGSRGC